MKPSPKPRVVLLQLSLKQRKKLQQPRQRRLLIEEVLERQKLYWSKILRKVVLVGVSLGCILTVRYVVEDNLGCKADHRPGTFLHLIDYPWHWYWYIVHLIHQCHMQGALAT